MRRHVPALAIVLAILVASTLLARVLGERIPLHEGFGFEAHSIYRPIVEELPRRLTERSIDAYSIQRLLPFAIAHVTLRALGRPLDGPHILLFFEIWNIAMLALAALVWVRLGEHLALSRAGTWLGLVGLLGSFAALKLGPYYPANIDTTALLLGMLLLFTWVRRRPGLLLATSMVGLTVWPTTLPVGLVLILLPPGTRLPTRAGPIPLGPALAAAAVAATWGAFGWAFLSGYEVPPGLAAPVPWLLPVSFLAVGAWLVAGLLPLARDGDEPSSDGWPWPSLARWVMAAGLVAAWLLLTRGLAAPGPPRLGASEFVFQYLAFGATSRPGQFAIAHVTYFGPIILVALLCWPSAASQLRALGAGAVAVGMLAVALGINSESRQLINLLPFLVVPTVLAAEHAGVSARLLPWAAGFAFVLSKVWFRINYAVEGLGEAGRSFPLGAGDFQAFPAQAWFLNFGPWMSNGMLLVQGAAAVSMALVLRRLLRTSRT